MHRLGGLIRLIAVTLIPHVLAASIAMAAIAAPQVHQSEQAGPDKNTDSAARTARISEMEAWLARLIGQFTLSGTYQSPAGTYGVDGTANCARMGIGPAVHCVISPTTRSLTDFKGKKHDRVGIAQINAAGHASLVQPTRIDVFYEIDPESLLINSVWITPDKQQRSGTLFHDSVTLIRDRSCVIRCRYSNVVSATPEGDISMGFGTSAMLADDYTLQLRRERSSGDP